MAKAVSATTRTLNAIRKADKLPRDLRVNNNRRGVSMLGRRKSSGSMVIYWAKIKSVIDAKNYLADIWYSRAAYSAEETQMRVRVWDIVETLAVDNWIPVIPAVPDPDHPDDDTGYDYECSQQLGILGDTIQP